MKVRDLIVELLRYPLDAQVIMPKSSGTSQHSPWSHVFPGCYIEEDEDRGDFFHSEGQCSPEDGCIKAVFLSSE